MRYRGRHRRTRIINVFLLVSQIKPEFLQVCVDHISLDTLIRRICTESWFSLISLRYFIFFLGLTVQACVKCNRKHCVSRWDELARPFFNRQRCVLCRQLTSFAGDRPYRKCKYTLILLLFDNLNWNLLNYRPVSCIARRLMRTKLPLQFS